MKKPLPHTLCVCLLFFCQFLSAQQQRPSDNNAPKIQVALLLDVSGSMNGLLEQAKKQLWNMAIVLSKVRCNEATPIIEIALYEYGRRETDLPGFIKQLQPFSTDLDQVFGHLNSLKTSGSQEFCGQVMYDAITQLNWGGSSTNDYKTIFIAGNESFLQGGTYYMKACEEAKKKNIFINTIYCGPRANGIEEFWNLGTECGDNGSFSNIDQDASPFRIHTPFDDSIIFLKDSLMSTFIVYGENGKKKYRQLMYYDTVATTNVNDPSLISKYVVTRASDNLYDHIAWDLVDAMKKNPGIIDSINMKTLDDSLATRSRGELRKIVEKQLFKRNELEAKIKDLSSKQTAFIKAEKEKQLVAEPLTLESEIEKIIRKQVMLVNMKLD